MITNWFTPEQEIVDAIRGLFPDDMVFVEAQKSELDNTIFDDIDNDGEKVAAIVRNIGFIPGSIVGKRESVNQKITQIYEVSIAAPKSLYINNIGALMVSVVKRLNGQILSPETVIKKLAEDREYNHRPEYVNDLAYLPVSFEVQTII